MKSMLKALSAVALSATIVHAGTDQKDLKKVIEDQGINYVETAQKGITLSGYVDTSYTEQFAGSGQYAPGGPLPLQNPGVGPANTQNTNVRQFDNSNATFNVDAVKIALEKALPDKNEWAAGFRIDTIYGSDAKYLGDSAFNGFGGLNNSGLAIEQALVKFRIPVGNGLDIYMGKFVTFLGYEVIESPANLNFSRGLLFTNAIPLTHTGIYADYKFNDTVEVKLGIVDGWNNGTSAPIACICASSAVSSVRATTPNVTPTNAVTTANRIRIGNPMRNKTRIAGSARSPSTAMTGKPTTANRIAIGMSAISASAPKNRARANANMGRSDLWRARPDRFSQPGR